MFKFIKILSGGVGVPEPVRIPKSIDTDIPIGAALTLENGVAAHPASTTAPQYVSAAASPAGKETSLLVYPLFPDMLFEVPVSGSPVALGVGKKVTLHHNSSGAAIDVSVTTANGVATIVDLQGAKNSGDIITVRFA